MAGMTLQHLVLQKLHEQPQTGYSLRKEMAQSTGQRPSFGSIYPILERLSAEGLVIARQDGRKKIYTLTAKGRTAVISLRQQQNEIFSQLMSHSRMVCAITGNDPGPMMTMLERLKKGDDPLKGISANAIRLRDLIFTMSQQGRITRNQKEINKVLEDAIGRLERMR